MTAGTLTIDLDGSRREISDAEVITFGRAGDILVDEANPYLHRLVGRFFWRSGRWWIENLGTFVELDVASVTGDLVHLPARGPFDLPVVAGLSGPELRVLFSSGSVSYQLSVTIDGPGTVVDPIAPSSGEEPQRGVVPLSDQERQLLEVLAEPRLRDPGLGSRDLPAPDEVALRLGWPVGTVERRLDHLCSRLTVAGARGLQRHPGQSPADRRGRLVEHAVDNQLVVPAASGPGTG